MVRIIVTNMKGGVHISINIFDVNYPTQAFLTRISNDYVTLQYHVIKSKLLRWSD